MQSRSRGHKSPSGVRDLLLFCSHNDAAPLIFGDPRGRSASSQRGFKRAIAPSYLNDFSKLRKGKPLSCSSLEGDRLCCWPLKIQLQTGRQRRLAQPLKDSFYFLHLCPRTWILFLFGVFTQASGVLRYLLICITTAFL